jgi:osmotically-inducible protein OsmY
VSSDSNVQRAVEAELSCHPSIDDTDIRVSAREGVVTLSGYVRNVFHKYGAEDAIKRVAGVTAVVNDIELQRGVRRDLTDPDIASDTVRALRRVLPLCAPRIRPLVRRGTVTLCGTVDAPYQRHVAEDAVRRLGQVRSVVNALTLAGGLDALAAPDIKRCVEERLRHSAHLDCGTIDVSVHGAQVTLSGRVHDWPQWREAEERAWSAPGVRQVHNALLVAGASRAAGTLRTSPHGAN